MKIDTHFKLRTIADETIVVNQGMPDTDLTRIISLNASARLLWEQLHGTEFSAEQAASVLAAAYHIPVQQAQSDADGWISALKKCQIIID